MPVPPPTTPTAPTVVYAPYVDAYAVHIDSERVREIAEQAREAAAVARLDRDAIREQARAAADAARASADQMREFKFVGPDLSDMHIDMPRFDFNFDFQERFQTLGRIDQSNDGGLYNSGLSAIQSGQYDRALTMFDRVIAQKGTRADGALYWKGYTLFKLARTDDTIATIVAAPPRLPRRAYWNDAKVLRGRRAQSGGPADVIRTRWPLTTSLLASRGLMNAELDRDPAARQPAGGHELAGGEEARHLRARDERRRAAHQILLNTKGAGNPDLQAEAIRSSHAARQEDD